jgi:hypothetical protein
VGAVIGETVGGLGETTVLYKGEIKIVSNKKENQQKSKKIIKLIDWNISYFMWRIILKDSKGKIIKSSFRFFNDDVFDLAPNLYSPKSTDIALRAIRRAASISSEYKRWIQSNGRDLLLKSSGVEIALNNILQKVKG